MKIYFVNILVACFITYGIVAYIDGNLNGIEVTGILLAVYTVLWLLSFVYSKSHFSKVPKICYLFFFFVKELIVASLKVAYDIITPRFLLNPAVIALPLEARSGLEITILANMISLTPGTLSIAVSEDRKVLYVHALYVNKGDTASLKNGIKQGFEKRLLEITR